MEACKPPAALVHFEPSHAYALGISESMNPDQMVSFPLNPPQMAAKADPPSGGGLAPLPAAVIALAAPPASPSTSSSVREVCARAAPRQTFAHLLELLQ